MKTTSAAINEILYPIKFEPILKEKVWGGHKLVELFNKSSTKKNLGESWEISDVEGNASVVVNGHLKDKTLPELVEKYRGALVGNHVYDSFKNKFPLLIKFIDAKEPLSIQVHPHDDLALKRHNSFGKTEMWYIMNAEEEGNLIVGFKKDSNRKEYLSHLKKGTLKEILNEDKVSEGDVYFIPTGRVHAIGGGVLLAEIQQTSDITYRIYDWNRPDQNGNYRELHTDLALDAIDYNARKSYKTPYTSKENVEVELINCDYFTTNQLKLNNATHKVKNGKDSFIIYMCVKGSCSFIYGDKQAEHLQQGQTVLIPASLVDFNILTDEEVTLLEVFIEAKK